MKQLSRILFMQIICLLPFLFYPSKLLVAQPVIDNDKDGIDDNEERRLLEKFRPFFMFSAEGGNENFRPTDARWYITKSEMLTSGDENQSSCLTNQNLAFNPNALIFFNNAPCAKYKSSDITKNLFITQYHINPMNSVGGVGNDPGRHGSDWPSVFAKKNTGLYGHVVPVKLQDPFGYDFNKVYDGHAVGTTFYKIEYWQFFGYNSADKPGDIGDHEGDWTSVQLIYDPQAKIIRSVFHFAHSILFRFNITPENNVRNVFFSTREGRIKEFRGLNFNFKTQALNLSHAEFGSVPPRIVPNDREIALAQNNVVRFFQDPVTQQFDHPVVYIEKGTHEFFPTENWSYYYAPNHNGQSYQYLTSTPPNLGEVEFPLREDAGANMILRFNGYWGAYGKYNTPPVGPPLHKNWLWPASSSVKWLINTQLGF